MEPSPWPSGMTNLERHSCSDLPRHRPYSDNLQKIFRIRAPRTKRPSRGLLSGGKTCSRHPKLREKEIGLRRQRPGGPCAVLRPRQYRPNKGFARKKKKVTSATRLAHRAQRFLYVPTKTAAKRFASPQTPFFGVRSPPRSSSPRKRKEGASDQSFSLRLLYSPTKEKEEERGPGRNAGDPADLKSKSILVAGQKSKVRTGNPRQQFSIKRRGPSGHPTNSGVRRSPALAASTHFSPAPKPDIITDTNPLVVGRTLRQSG